MEHMVQHIPLMLVENDVKVQEEAESCMLIIRWKQVFVCFHETTLASHKTPVVVRDCKSTHTAAVKNYCMNICCEWRNTKSSQKQKILHGFEPFSRNRFEILARKKLLFLPAV